MDDLISRQNAINTALDFFVEFLGGAFHEDDQKILMKRMNELPSAEPERKTGKWIYKHCVWFCSECGENPTKGMGYVQGHDELYDFCPNCGAAMNQEVEE